MTLSAPSVGAEPSLSIVAWPLLLVFALVLMARGGKVDPVALAAQASILAAAGVALWRGAWALPAGLPFSLTVLATLQAASAFLSGVPEGAFLTLGRFWTAPAFAVLAARAWGRVHWRVFAAIVLSVAVAQALLIAGWHGRLSLLPGNLQYGALWMTCALFFLPEIGQVPVAARLLFGGVLFAGVALSAIRSAFAGLVAGGFCWAAHRFGRRGTALLILGVLSIVVLLPRGVWESLLKAGDPAAWKRLDIWGAAVRGILSHPWLGNGPGQFEALYRLHGLPQEGGLARFDHSTLFAHNDYLQLAAASGLPALIVFLWSAGLFIRFGAWRRPASAAAAAAGAVFACFNFPFALPADVLAAGGLLAFLSPRGDGGSRAPLRVLGGFLLALAAVPLSLLPLSLQAGPAERPFYGRAADLLSRSETLAEDPSRRPESERLARRSLSLAPGRAEGWRQWAFLLAEDGKAEESARALRHALALHPHNAPWWVDLGLLEESRGGLDEASAAFHQALRVEPRYAEAAFHLGRLMCLRGEGEKARAWLERLLQQAHPAPPPDASPYLNRVLGWDAGAVRGELARWPSGRKDIIRRYR